MDRSEEKYILILHRKDVSMYYNCLNSEYTKVATDPSLLPISSSRVHYEKPSSVFGLWGIGASYKVNEKGNIMFRIVKRVQQPILEEDFLIRFRDKSKLQFTVSYQYQF